MQDLIAAITKLTTLDALKAEKAVGILLNLVATQGDKTKVTALFDKMPGGCRTC